MLDWLFVRAEIDPKALVHLHEEAGIIAVASSLLLWGLVLYFIAKPWFAKKEACAPGESCGCS
jgi:hypothetical protein